MKLFVWDFHGVLEKGNDNAVVEITNLALMDHGFDRRLSVEESELLSGKRWHEYFGFLLPEISIKECIQLQQRCFEISRSHPEIVAKHIQLNDHAELVLEEIQRKGYLQILISNTQPDALDHFVQAVGVEKYFSKELRFGVDSHSQTKLTKVDCLNAFLKKSLFHGAIVSIGDSPSDMALIHHRTNSVGYLYTHPGRSHRPVDCHYKINDLRDILKEVS